MGNLRQSMTTEEWDEAQRIALDPASVSIDNYLTKNKSLEIIKKACLKDASFLEEVLQKAKEIING